MSTTFFWFRRDLRLEDNHGLWAALSSGNPVIPVFIFDSNILNTLRHKDDRRLTFIHHTLEALDKKLRSFGSGLLTAYGDPEIVWKTWIQTYSISAVFLNNDYEPYARNRDDKIKTILGKAGIPMLSYKDQVIFEKSEIVKADGLPYTVFTPYKNKFLSVLKPEMLKSYASDALRHNLKSLQAEAIPSLQSMGFRENLFIFPERKIPVEIVQSYDKTRDYPALQGTSRLSLHLRFGTLSIRQLVEMGLKHNQTWLNELIWREFYKMILWNFPQVEKQAFKPEYDKIQWLNRTEDFEAWCEGQTGYPIVDAGMRELKATGYMHNRVRMITASFLTKHLLIDWRWGEAWFAENLLDYDLSANNGGWQWAAGSGCDAAPYFRVFNPGLQTQKFDSKTEYIRTWVPEFNTSEYIQPIVNHTFARNRAIDTYKKAIGKPSL